jgi:Fe2+ or Zn2+ uptake regulation protein
MLKDMSEDRHPRKTATRSALRRAMESLRGPFSPRELRDAAQPEARPDLATVYRFLRLLQHEGEIREISSSGGSRFELLRSRDHPHFRCRRCGECSCLDAPEAMKALLASAPGRVERTTVLFEGICPRCIREEEREPS